MTAPTADRGFHVSGLDPIGQLSPDYEKAYRTLADLPWNHGPLPKWFKALVYVAVNATATQMHREGTDVYIRKALELGATSAQVMEVLQLASTVGIHACILGVPALMDAIDPTRERCLAEIAASPRLSAMKEKFVAQRGYWSPIWDGLLWLSPEYFDAFIAFSSEPWIRGTLAPKYKELIYISTASTATHQFEIGARIHIRNALDVGATADEIAEVLQLVSAIGIHAFGMGAPILAKELAARAADCQQSGMAPD
jgi:alkylhydroperoxidase/carboxymuconolactone decarboxylase family protein YurZ